MFKLIAKLFGTKSEKDIKLVMPLVQEAIREGEKLLTVSNDELRNKTTEIQAVINTKLKSIDDQLAALHQQIADNAEMDLNEKEAVFARIDKIEGERNKELEKVLLEILPQAFAIIRETARRFKENEYLEVTAHDFDIHYAATHENVKINGDKALWYNKWMAAGNLITWSTMKCRLSAVWCCTRARLLKWPPAKGRLWSPPFPLF